MLDPSLDGDQLLKFSDVMEFCRVGRTTAYEIMAEIPERFLIKGGLRVRRRDLQTYLNKQASNALTNNGHSSEQTNKPIGGQSTNSGD